MGKWMREYLLDAGRLSELINQVYKSPEIQETIGENGGQYDPVNPDWIDLKGSAEMTMAMQNMLPKEFPLLTVCCGDKGSGVDVDCRGRIEGES